MAFRHQITFAGMPKAWQQGKKKSRTIEIVLGAPSKSRGHRTDHGLTTGCSAAGIPSCIGRLCDIGISPDEMPAASHGGDAILKDMDVLEPIIGTGSSLQLRSDQDAKVMDARIDERDVWLQQVSADAAAAGRLKAEDVSDDEIKALAPLAIMKFAQFYGADTHTVSICRIVRSSAGLRGWATAAIGLPEKVVTLSLLEECSDGSAVILCITPGGGSTTVSMAAHSSLYDLNISLGNILNLHHDRIRLILPSARLLQGSDYESPILQLLRGDMIESTKNESQVSLPNFIAMQL